MFIIPAHKAATFFLRYLVFQKRLVNARLIVTQITTIQIVAVLLQISPAVTTVKLSGDRHIELQRLRFWKLDLKPVLADDEGEAAAVVPLHMELACVIDMFQSPHTSRGQCVGIIFHFRQSNARPLGILLPEKVQPLFLYLHLAPPTWSCPDLGTYPPIPDGVVLLPRKSLDRS